ncbi:hypothetical protein HQ520_00795, partial [bacterium]|nr:hypothetical protein [bacterium]
MRVDRSLDQISEIHEQVAKSQFYRGYRAIPSVAAGVFAVGAAWLQPLVVPGTDPLGYVLYWTLVAVAAFLISGGGVVFGYVREADAHVRRRTRVVVGQLMPCLVVGVIMTGAFVLAEDRG